MNCRCFIYIESWTASLV